ncbi:NnrS family protein [Methylotenera versatilis]|uniref:NnrS family protein n=1 Tax=Methylotenera versatilis TaxID=1055487 RepID=UPI0006465426|nr:NnrS family protein [Methylotenera versatilis]
MQQNIPIPELSPAKKQSKKIALFDLGFRPFFLGASIFSIVSLSLWMAIYALGFEFNLENIRPSQWHAHEMLYGYAFAVIAGFLLTAVKNWTGIQTLHGKPLLALFMLWVSARLIMLINPTLMIWAALFDAAFMLGLSAAIAIPIVKVKQWRQLGVLTKVAMLGVGNIAFYAGALGCWANGAQVSIIIGLYLTVSMILVISRRVLPMFIERGVQEQVKLKQFKWLDISIMLLLVGLLLNEVALQSTSIGILAGSLLFLTNGFRLFNWHTKGIWKVPLLWSLYCGLWLINLGFLFTSLSYLTSSIGMIFAIHLLAVGGIGLITVAMMARVALGHTGRNIHQPPRMVSYAFGLLIVGAILRSIFPVLASEHYLLWVVCSYLCWLLAFAIFVGKYCAILIKPRIDGMLG